MSDWNRFFDRKLALDLTGDEHRLADALARNLLGFRTLEDRIGDRWLMEQSGLRYARSFERAREGLVAKGLLCFERGTPGRGRGHRGFYRLLLDVPEMPADERAFGGEEETPAEERALGAEMPAENPAPVRAGIGQGVELGFEEEVPSKRDDLVKEGSSEWKRLVAEDVPPDTLNALQLHCWYGDHLRVVAGIEFDPAATTEELAAIWRQWRQEHAA